MNSSGLQRLVWLVYRAWERLNLLGQLALALIVCAILFFTMSILPQQSALQNMQVTALQSEKVQAPRVVTVEQTLQIFKARFPRLSERAEKIKKLMDIAAAHGLLLDDVTYRNEHRPNDDFYHYRVEFSLFATYTDVHQFLADVLSQMPYVSIESLNISREAITEEIVEAKVQLAFHFVGDENE